MVKKSKIMAIVLATMVLAVIASGTASAKEWSSYDCSVKESGSIGWDSTCPYLDSTGDPYLSWANYFAHADSSHTSAYYPQITWAGGSGKDNCGGYALNYGWTSNRFTESYTGSSGTHTLQVTHKFRLYNTDGSSGDSVSTWQEYKV